MSFFTASKKLLESISLKAGEPRRLMRQMSGMPRSSPRCRPARTERFLPCEALEPRTLFSTAVWTGLADGTSWNNAGNWLSGSVPGASSDVIIGSVSGATISATGTISAHSINCATPFSLSNATLSVAASSTFNGGLTADFSTINGPGTITNAVGLTLSLSGTTVNAPLVNFGNISVVGTFGSTINGSLSTTATSAIKIGSNSTDTGPKLTLGTDFTNNGAILITDNGPNGAFDVPEIDLNSHTITNSSTGQINVSNQTYTGSFTYSFLYGGSLVNQGTVIASGPDNMAFNSVTINNSGNFDVLGGTLTLGMTFAGPFINTGVVSISSGATLTQSGGTSTFGGTLLGAGTFNVTGGTLAIPTALSNTLVALNFTDSTINGPGTLANSAGKTMTFNQDTINAPMVNTGTLNVTGTFASAINGGLTTVAGSSIQLASVTGDTRPELDLGTDFTNYGTITLADTGPNGAFDAPYINLNSHTITNIATGAINVSNQTYTGTYTYVFLYDGNLINQGTITISGPDNIAFNSIGLTNNGSLNVTGGSLILGATFAAPFTNASSISISAGASISQSGGTSALGGSIAGGGTLTYSNVNVTLNTFSVDTLANLNFVGGTVGGTGTLTNADGQTLGLSGTTVNVPIVNQSTLNIGGAFPTSLNGSLTTATGSTIQITADAANAFPTLKLSSDLINLGTINLTANAANSADYPELNLNGHTLTNAPGATVGLNNLSYIGSSPFAFLYNGPLVNTGILNVAGSHPIPLAGLTNFLTNGTGAITENSDSTLQLPINVLGTTVNSATYSAQGTFLLSGGTAGNPLLFEVMGADLGNQAAGYTHNYAYGTIQLAANSHVKLVDQSVNSISAGAEALYANNLIVPANSTLDTNGLHVYSKSYQIGGTILHPTIHTDLSSVNPSIVGQPVSITATVTLAPGSGTPTGTVTLNDGVTVLGSMTLVGGAATFTSLNLSLGTHLITAFYSGDGTYSATTSPPYLQTVGLPLTTTAITSSTPTITVGQAVTFFATVQGGPGTPTGVVTFLDGTATLGSASLNGNVATFSTSSLATGTHSITASYLGDTAFSPSLSGAINQVVNPVVTSIATTTTLVVGLSNLAFGSTLTFVATVTAATSSPTGSVAFLDGTTTLGTGVLTGSGATLTTSFHTSQLAPGPHTITAVFLGTSPFVTSASSAQTLDAGTPHQRFVAQLYRDLLGREVDAGGLGAWTGALDSGTTYAQVATDITSSREYDGIIVDAFYFNLLGRHAEAGGLNAWVDQMQTGLNAQVIRAGILGSDEYFNRTGPNHNNGTTTTFVTALYQTFLGRSPDTGGLSAWLGVLGTNPANRQTVAAGISNSDENRTVIITGFYQTYLHRNPDGAGLVAWKSELAGGISQPAIVSFFVTTPEYLGRLGISG